MLRKDVYRYLIKPTLAEIGLGQDNDDKLVYLTGIGETNYDYLFQIGTPRNGGIGWFQDEPSDYKDVCGWLINGFNKDLLGKVLKACYLVNLPQDPNVLAWNMRLAICICRIHYYRVKEKIPSTIEGMADYYLKYYNTYLGKATKERIMDVFTKANDEIDS